MYLLQIKNSKRSIIPPAFRNDSRKSKGPKGRCPFLHKSRHSYQPTKISLPSKNFPPCLPMMHRRDQPGQNFLGSFEELLVRPRSRSGRILPLENSENARRVGNARYLALPLAELNCFFVFRKI